MLRTLTYSKQLTLRHNILYAPLAGCTDVPMRLMSARYRPALMFCEMLKMDALVRRHPGTLAMAHYTAAMRPIGAQLVGSKPSLAKESARIVEELGFDVVDLNCGCPVDKVTKDGSGSGLLKEPERIGEIVSELVAGSHLPVTVKVRLGWDDDAIVLGRVIEVVRAAGARAITIHARTREQGYSGTARWEWLKWAKEQAGDLLVIGNGDLFQPQDAVRMLEETGVDGVLIARGTMGQPWIAEQICDLLEGRPLRERGEQERILALIEHFELACQWFPERKALLDLRRFGAWYLHHAEGARQLRARLNTLSTLDEARALLQELVERAALVHSGA